MKNDRIKEISDFANDFNKRLELSERQLIKDKTIKKIKGRNKIKLNNSIFQRESRFSPQTRTKFTMNKDFFKPLLPWVPNSLNGNYFNKFEKLNDAHNITIWEKVKFLIFYLMKYRKEFH